jgi:hypothetical protein
VPSVLNYTFVVLHADLKSDLFVPFAQIESRKDVQKQPVLLKFEKKAPAFQELFLYWRPIELQGERHYFHCEQPETG